MDILLPSLSAGMVSGTVTRWLKSEGDDVTKGEPLVEIETDKATMEVTAEVSGRIAAIYITAGSNADVSQAIGKLTVDGEIAAKQHPVLRRAEESAIAAAATKSRARDRTGLRSEGRRIVASPLARRLAKENAIDLWSVSGSGPRGRIVRIDIERALSAANEASLPAPAATERNSAAAINAGAHSRIPHSTMRATIARRLLESKTTVPHFYLETDVSASALLALRAEINAVRPDKRISINDLIIKASACALSQIPSANAIWTPDAVLRFDTIDIAVAVTTDSGLYTPVVRDAGRKSVAGISSEMTDLIQRARKNRLQPSDYQGGSFSISNLGMYGVKSFAAIINPPQSCILAVGACEKRPAARGGIVVIDDVMTCTLSADHRVLDGALASELLAAIKDGIERPMRLLV